MKVLRFGFGLVTATVLFLVALVCLRLGAVGLPVSAVCAALIPRCFGGHH